MSKNAAAARGRGAKPATPERVAKELARVFRSLADEHRLKILFLLASHEELHVSAISEELGQSQPAVSHHLTQLRNVGLIDYRRDGKFNFYALDPEGIADLVAQMFPTGPARVAFGGVEIGIKTRKG